MGQGAPGDATPHHVMYGIDDLAQGMHARPPAGTSRRQQRFQMRPLRIGHVGGVVAAGHVRLR